MDGRGGAGLRQGAGEQTVLYLWLSWWDGAISLETVPAQRGPPAGLRLGRRADSKGVGGCVLLLVGRSRNTPRLVSQRGATAWVRTQGEGGAKLVPEREQPLASEPASEPLRER